MTVKRAMPEERVFDDNGRVYGAEMGLEELLREGGPCRRAALPSA